MPKVCQHGDTHRLDLFGTGVLLSVNVLQSGTTQWVGLQYTSQLSVRAVLNAGACPFCTAMPSENGRKVAIVDPWVVVQ